MAFHITITADAEAQWQALPTRQRRLLEAAIQTRLVHQPTVPTKAVKRLRPNPFAEFELRVGDLRVLYNVEGTEVVLLVVGRKVGNKLIVKGAEFHGHQDHSPESAGDEPSGDVG
jgi:mRNA-degrading endonuclease RelE of RelBE toxin-antitoxin system